MVASDDVRPGSSVAQVRNIDTNKNMDKVDKMMLHTQGKRSWNKTPPEYLNLTQNWSPKILSEMFDLEGNQWCLGPLNLRLDTDWDQISSKYILTHLLWISLQTGISVLCMLHKNSEYISMYYNIYIYVCINVFCICDIYIYIHDISLSLSNASMKRSVDIPENETLHLCTLKYSIDSKISRVTQPQTTKNHPPPTTRRVVDEAIIMFLSSLTCSSLIARLLAGEWVDGQIGFLS